MEKLETLDSRVNLIQKVLLGTPPQKDFDKSLYL